MYNNDKKFHYIHQIPEQIISQIGINFSYYVSHSALLDKQLCRSTVYVFHQFILLFRGKNSIKEKGATLITIKQHQQSSLSL